MKYTKLFIIICATLCFLTMQIYAGTYSGGAGTSGDPYQIASTSDLIELSKTSADWGANFIQTTNISLNANEQLVDWDGDGSATWDAQDQLGLSPIGNNTTNFTGVYDGQNNTISNLYIKRTSQDNIGLFGRTGSASELRNLEVSNVDITGDEYVGGVVGNNDGLVMACNSSGYVYGRENAGLIVGFLATGTIQDCSSAGDVAGQNSIGGLLGGNFAGTVILCSSTGTVTGNNNVGGLVGFNFVGPTRNSFSSSEVIGLFNTVGGLIGVNYDIVANCYAIGDVTGNNKVGGFMGSNSGTVSNCYSTGLVVGNTNVGGFLGETFSSESNCFWDTETSNQATSAGGTGKTTAEMKTKSTFTNAGWDFNAIWNIYSSLNNGYPYLRFSYRIYVDATRPDDVSDGTNWSKAKKTLQAALDLATSGYEIWVKSGTYKPTSAYDLTNTSRYYHFRMKNSVEIFGGFGGTEITISDRTDFGEGGANETTLSGDLNDDDIDNDFSSNKTDNCYHVFYHPEGLWLSSIAIIDGFTIKGGHANGTNPHQRGGGLYNYSNGPQFRNILFSNNYATNAGGGIFNEELSNMIIIDCQFIENKTNGDGGGIKNVGSSATMKNVIFSNNIATWGGAIYCYEGNHTFTNGLLTNNSAGSKGGAIYLAETVVEFNNFTISNNSATSWGGGICCYYAIPTLNNSIIFSNTAAVGKEFYIEGELFTTTLNYSCYSNGTGDIYNDGATFTATNNNITSNPQFLDAPNGDFRLFGSSPCVNTGDNSYNPETYDIRGADRIQFTTIDMGAYEWTSGYDKSNPIYVSEDYNSGTSGFGVTHYNNLSTGLTNATTDATVNITNYSHTCDVDMTGRTFIIGTQDFDITGNLSGGQIQVSNTGKLMMNDIVANITKSFPITDGTYNYTMTITTADVNNPDISVRISNLNPTGSINSDFWDIMGPNNLDATVTLRIDKAAIAPKTLSNNTQIRYYDNTDNRYVVVNGNNFSIEEFDTYYIITITSVNEF